MNTYKIAYNFMFNINGKNTINSLYYKPTIVNIENLKYACQKQIAQDTVEISKESTYTPKKILPKETILELLESGMNMTDICRRYNLALTTVRKHLKYYGLYKPNPKAPCSPLTIPQETLQELVDKGLTMDKIASERSVPFGKVRYNLKKYNMMTENQIKYKALKDYYYAKTNREKDIAFNFVDKYLEKIAQKKFETKKGISYSYEDCLQDIRLKFLEQIDKYQKKGNRNTQRILNFTSKNNKIKKQVPTVSLNEIEDISDKIITLDTKIENFEAENFYNRIWEYAHAHLSKLEINVLEQYFKEGKNSSEIAASIGRSPRQTNAFLNRIIAKLRIKINIGRLNNIQANGNVKYINIKDVL